VKIFPSIKTLVIQNPKSPFLFSRGKKKEKERKKKKVKKKKKYCSVNNKSTD